MTVRRTLIIFAKVPVPGRVKSRLGAGIGPIAATWWYRHQVRDLVRRLGNDPRWHTVLAVSPDAAGLSSRSLPSGVERRTQGSGNLGRRMIRALRTAAPGPAVVVGSDIPGIAPRHIARAFALLGKRDAVIGPSGDGGYWLIGLRHPMRTGVDCLDGVRWSTRHAASDTIARIGDERTARADILADIDTAEDLVRFRQDQGSVRPIRMR